jgi:hypothetical protein
MAIVIRNKKNEEDIKNIKRIIESKTGKSVPMTRVIQFVTENSEIIKELEKTKCSKQKRKKEWLFKL